MPQPLETAADASRPAAGDRLRARADLLADALRASEERARRIIATANDAFVGMDAGGRVTEWNDRATAMFGWERDEVLGLTLADLIVPERFRAAHRRGLERFLATGEGPVLGSPVELVGLHRSGAEVPLELTVWALAEAQGWCFNAFLRDISERKAAEAQLRDDAAALAAANAALRAADAVKDDFLAMTSHELRTPLTAILGYAAMLQTRWDDLADDERRDAVAIIERQSEGLRRLVSDLLTVSTIQAGALELAIGPTPVAPIVARAIQAAAGDDAGIATRCPAGATVLADQGRLEQILVNLLTNALKYGEPPVSVEVSVDRRTVELHIRDHGPGVAAAFVPQLFEKFSQASRGDSRDARGTGLGLAIVRSLAEAQGGSAWYAPGPERGAVFAVRLPVADRARRSAPRAREQARRRVGGGNSA